MGLGASPSLPSPQALSLPPCPPGQLRWVPPHPTGHPSKNIIFLLFVRVKNTTQVAKFAPSPLPPTPPEPKPLDPRLPSPCTPPTPQGILQKNLFLFFVRVRNVKNTTQVAKFAPSLGPVPLPPTPPAPKPLDPPPSPSPWV